MLIIPPPQNPRRRGKVPRKPRAASPPPPPPAALTLVSATYDPGFLTVTLVFDRAINFSGYVGTSLFVDDQLDTGWKYQGTGGASAAGPNGMTVLLVDPTPAVGEDTKLTVAAGNGIVAVDDGGTWAGVSDLILPFP